MESYSVEAILSAKDSGFTSTMKAAADTASSAGSAIENASSKYDGAFQDKNGRWRAANGRFLTIKEQSDMLGKSFDETSGKSQKMNSSIMDIAKGIGVFKLVDAGIGLVRDSLDGAISRFDTLNKYPTVMTALGYSADQVESSMNKLSDGIDGLPTSLDEIVANTQQLAISTGDLDKGTDTAIALNNAFLASGASTADASRGMQQYVQMLSKGTVDIQSWRSIQETMPIAMDKVAKSFEDRGVKSVNELYDALQGGQITFDEFNNRLIELNDGVGGFAELAQKNSAGIATSFSNIKTAVVKGLANVITAIDDGMQNAGLGSIAENLNKVKDVVNNVFTGIVAIVPTLVTGITSLINIFKALKPVIVTVTAAFVAYKTAIGIASIVSSLSKAMTVLKVAFAVGNDVKLLSFALGNMASASKLAAAGQAVLNAVMSINPFALVIAAITAVVAALVYFFTQTEAGQEAWARLVDGFGKAMEMIKNAISSAVEWIQDAWSGTKEWFVNAWNGIGEFFSNLWEGITDTVSNAVESVQNAWDGVKEFFSGLWDGIKQGATDAWESLTSTVTGVFSKIIAPFEPLITWFGSLWDSISTMAGSAWEIIKTVIMGPILLLIDLVTGNFEQLKEDASMIWTTLTTNISTIVTTFVSIVTGYYTAFVETVVNLWNNLTSSVTDLWTTFTTWISQTVDNLVNGVVQTWENFKQSTIDLFNNTIQTAQNAWESFKTWIINLVVGIKDSAVQSWENLKQGTIDTFNNLVSGAQQAWDNLVTGISNVINSVFEWFDKLKNINLLDIGKAIIDGFVNGLKNAWESGKDFIGGIGDWIRENKGPIQYDRKLLIPAGNAIMEGLNNGLINGFGTVQSTVGGIGDRISDAMNTDYSMDIGANVARANRSINSEVTHQVNYGGNSTPAIFKTIIGKQQFEIFVEDISNAQGKQTELYLEY